MSHTHAMTSSAPKILIVGSGPAGCILALTLLKNGVPVKIIEKDMKHHEGTRGPSVIPRTLELEHFLGVRADIERHSISGLHVRIYDPKDPHRVSSSTLMSQITPPTPSHPTGKNLIVPQYLHEMELRKHIEAQGGRIELGVAFSGLKQDEDGVNVELSVTKDERVTVVKERFQYVIGADGGHSTIRKAIGIAFLGETREDEKMYIADCKVEGLEEKDIHTWTTEKRERVVLRFTGQPKIFQLIFSGSEKNMDIMRMKEVSKIQQVVHEVTGRTDIRITDVTWQADWRPNIRIAERFRSGRVFLIGDAAHTHSPAGAQGLNSGAMDAFNLAWKLALVAKGNATPDLLNSFELERLPVIAEMLKISTGLHDKFRKDLEGLAPLIPSSVDVSVSEAAPGEGGDSQSKESADAWSRSRKLFQLGVNYRWSPIVVDKRLNGTEAAKQLNAYGTDGHEVRAGDRAPDAPDLHVVRSNNYCVGLETRLFDIFTPEKHTIIIFASDIESELLMLEAIQVALSRVSCELMQSILILPAAALKSEDANVDTILKDTKGHARNGYGIDGGHFQVVIVRPDGVIGAFIESDIISGLSEYFSLVFCS